MGRSQNGMAGGSSRPLAPWPPPWPAESWGALWTAGGAGRRPPERLVSCRGPAVGQPLTGQAGRDPPDKPDPPDPPDEPDPPEEAERRDGPGPPEDPEPPNGPEPPDPPEEPRLTGEPEVDGEPAERPRTGVPDDGDAGAAGPGQAPPPADRPAPRDQPEADPALPLPLAGPGRGGRSSGGATRPLAPSASVTFLARAELTPAPRREPAPVSPFASAGGGASGRSRDA